MSNHGKKIPSTTIKDQATRQAFDSVQARLAAIEKTLLMTNRAVGDRIVYFDLTADFKDIPGMSVALTVDGQHDVFIGLRYAKAATQVSFGIDDAGEDVKATYRFLRDGVAIDTLSFFEVTAVGAAGVSFKIPPSAVNTFDSPDKGTHTWSFQMKTAQSVGTIYGVEMYAFEVK